MKTTHLLLQEVARFLPEAVCNHRVCPCKTTKAHLDAVLHVKLGQSMTLYCFVRKHQFDCRLGCLLMDYLLSQTLGNLW